MAYELRVNNGVICGVIWAGKWDCADLTRLYDTLEEIKQDFLKYDQRMYEENRIQIVGIVADEPKWFVMQKLYWTPRPGDLVKSNGSALAGNSLITLGEIVERID